MNKNRVRELREARHLSQERLGEFTDISQQVISGIECSDSCLAKDDMIILADFFEVSTDYLLGIDQEIVLDISGLDSESVQVLNRMVQFMRHRQK